MQQAGGQMDGSMYIPASFHESELPVIHDLIDRHGFATLISAVPGGGEAGSPPEGRPFARPDARSSPFVSHVPLLLDRSEPGRDRLLGHLARANRHWKCFDGTATSLAIFHGPHAYISPSWYPTHPSVPTWNYAVVHVHGAPTALDSDRTWEIVQRLVEKYESGRTNRWYPSLPPDFLAADLRAIVGFEMPIDRIEAKFKLGQNRIEADRAGALAGLEREEDQGSRELARFARAYFARRDSRSDR
jgi:transcriptional regulator